MDLIPYLYFFQDYLLSPTTNYPPINDLDLLFDSVRHENGSFNGVFIVSKLAEKINTAVGESEGGNDTKIDYIFSKIQATGLLLDYNFFKTVIKKIHISHRESKGLKDKYVIRAVITENLTEPDPVTGKMSKSTPFLDMNCIDIEEMTANPEYADENFMVLEGTKFKIIKKDKFLEKKKTLVQNYQEHGAKAIDLEPGPFAQNKVDNWKAQIDLLEKPKIFNTPTVIEQKQKEIIYGIVIFLELLDQTIFELGLSDLNLKIVGGFAAHMHARCFYLFPPEQQEAIQALSMMQYPGTEEGYLGEDGIWYTYEQTQTETEPMPEMGENMREPVYFETENAGGYRGGTKRRRKSRRKSKRKKNKKSKSKKNKKTRKTRKR